MKAVQFHTRSLLTAALALALLLTAAAPVPALADGEWRYFAETGCWVGNEFLDFYDKRGGLDIFGYPIENAILEDGLTVQYFQRSRMELHPEAPAPYRVQLGLLGQELLGRVDPPVTHDRLPSPGDRNHEYFAETGQVVSYSFLEYFQGARRGGHFRLPHQRPGHRERGGGPVLSARPPGVAPREPGALPRPARPDRVGVLYAALRPAAVAIAVAVRLFDDTAYASVRRVAIGCHGNRRPRPGPGLARRDFGADGVAVARRG